jgi:hypothetical protein
MAAILYLLRDYRGSVALSAQVIAGSMVYALVLAALNFLDLRNVVMHRFTGGRRDEPAVVATAAAS